jgi:hypothetical protein
MANTRKLENELNRIRHEQDAFIALVIMPNEVHFSTDPKMQPRDIAERLREEAPLIQAYIESKKAGRA